MYIPWVHVNVILSLQKRLYPFENETNLRLSSALIFLLTGQLTETGRPRETTAKFTTDRNWQTKGDNS